jgi:hypothetical protein
MSTDDLSQKDCETDVLNADSRFTKYQEFLELMNNCSLCGSKLKVIHTIELPGSMIREEATCPHCDIRARNKIFNIQ